MRTILIPHQQDLHTRYELDGVNSPMIINQRFVNWVNSHPDMLAVVIPYDDKYIEYILNTSDDIGVMLPGGEDIGMFPERDEFELKLIQACSDTGTPLFGICKGMQLINHYMGGTLRRCDRHWQDHVEHAASHSVRLNENSIFADKIVSYNIPVNSFHNWCVNKPGGRIEICGYSNEEHDHEPVAECLRVIDKPIAAVQWHPSYMINHYVSQALLELFYDLPNLR